MFLFRRIKLIQSSDENKINTRKHTQTHTHTHTHTHTRTHARTHAHREPKKKTHTLAAQKVYVVMSAFNVNS